MRTIRVDEPESNHTWLWLAGGAVLGVVATVLITGRVRGERGSVRSLARRGRQLAAGALDAWGPLLETARTLKDAWSGPEEEEDEYDEDLEDTAPVAEDDDLDAEYEDDPDEEEEDAPEADALDARVLEAFIHDPVLAEREVEIEERRPGLIVLHGALRSAREVKHAVTIARGVPGVEQVRPKLTVAGRSR